MPKADGRRDTSAEQTQRVVKHYTALAHRNLAAKEALEDYFRLIEAEAHAIFIREALAVLESSREEARRAEQAGVPFPVEVVDVDLQLVEMEVELKQNGASIHILNIKLRQRLGFQIEERLWPETDLGINPEPVDLGHAIAMANAHRPELLALRAAYQGLTAEDAARDRQPAGFSESMLGRYLIRQRASAPASQGDLSFRKQQLLAQTATLEREAADETRSAAAALESQLQRVVLTRQRLALHEIKLSEAIQKSAARIPGAIVKEAQARVGCIRTRIEMISEVAAWHRYRIQLLAAQGSLQE